jgi:iron complex outermembrane receptor protein
LPFSRFLSAIVLIVFAKAQPLAANSVEEVVVTARQRAEAPLDVPVAISVFSRETIKRRQIVDLDGLAAAAPGFSMSDPFGRLNPSPALRGLAQPGIGDEPSVGLFIDGVYVFGRSSLNLLMGELERIEVIRGPQSALYGRNTFGGAINLVTRKPGRATTIDGEVTIGSKNRYDVRLGIGGPLSSSLAGRLYAVYRDWGGFYENSVADGPKIGRERSVQTQASLLFTPFADFDAYLRISYAEDDDTQPKSFLLDINCGPRSPDGALREYCGTVPSQPVAIGGAANVGFAANLGHRGFQRDAFRAALTLNWRLDFATLTTISAYANEHPVFGFDGDYQPVVAYDSGQAISRHDVGHEFRLASRDRQTVKWLLGASSYRLDNRTERRNIFYVQGRRTPEGPRTDESTDAYAIYGSLATALPGETEASVDLRWSRERKSFRSPNLRDRVGTPLDLAAAWNAWTPRFALSRKLGASALLYVSAARGFKTGGFNLNENIFADERRYDPETNWTYELGGKFADARGAATATLALFWIDWRNQQVVAASAAGTANNFFNNNAGRSRSRGIEFDAAWRIGRQLRLQASYAFTDARFLDYQDPDLIAVAGFAPRGDVSGKLLPRQSRHHAHIGAMWEAPLRAIDGTWFAETTLSYRSGQYATSAELASTGGNRTLDIRIGAARGPWKATFFLDNLFNDRSPEVAIRWFDPARGFRRAMLVTPSDGSTFGLTLRYQFGS